MTPEALLLLSTARGVCGDLVPGGIPEWTQADVGLALRGVSERDSAAALLHYTGDASYARLLYLPLTEFAIQQRKQKKWGKRVAGKLWLEGCVTMALEEYRNPRVRIRGGWWLTSTPHTIGYADYSSPGATWLRGWWSKWVDVPEKTWTRALQPRYEMIYQRLVVWGSIATDRMRRNIGRLTA